MNADRVNGGALPHAEGILSTTIGFVKYQARHAAQTLQRRQSGNSNSDYSHLEKVVSQYDDHLEILRDTAKDFEILRLENESLKRENKSLNSATDAFTDNTVLTPEDLEGLPDELIKELSLTEADRQDFELLAVVKELGGQVSLDKMLVNYYRRTNEILDRSKLNQRVYRMAQKGLLHAVPGRKGVYSAYTQAVEYVGADQDLSEGLQN